MLVSTTNTIRVNSSHHFRVRSRAAASALNRFIDTFALSRSKLFLLRASGVANLGEKQNADKVPFSQFPNMPLRWYLPSPISYPLAPSASPQHSFFSPLRYSGKTEAVAGSGSDSYFLSSSSGTISGEYRLPSSSRAPGVTFPQPVVAMAISSTGHALFDRPSQLPLFTHNPNNNDMLISLPSLLGPPTTPTSSSSSSPFATSRSRAVSRIAAMRRNEDSSTDGNSDEDTSSSFTAAPSATLATDSKGSKGEETKTTQSHSSGPPPGHGSSTDTPVPDAPTTVVTSYYTPSEQDATTLLTTATPTTAIVSGTSTTPVSPDITKGPHVLISQSSVVMMTITSEWTSGGHTYLTTMTLGSISLASVQPSSTGTVASAPSTSESSHLSLILGLVFAVVFLVALGVIIYKWRRRRRRAGLLPQPPLSDHENRDYQEWLLRDPAPLVATPATLRGNTPTPPLVERVSHWRSRCRSQGDSSLPMSEVLSDPFADGSFAVTSQTSEPAPNNHFAIFGESLSTLHTTDNSELNFLAPIPSNAGTSIHSSYFSPTGHYHGRPPPPDTSTSDATEKSSPVFHAGSERSRALLDEARRS
ncbi:hypothetical protein DEU56DRAFT_899295 [Suillus clintonianus]|uniref:uncharacterized protein n=1 Tax=Suillus clintonianus TaxID=1904413 RepID=UPI001B87FB95|nr:uncharacterized protein DEU56DRAFT_899295 [Suillus clintonianus]KAG2147993.1 hypothetical protein DEU56DRAFT_899295 [Suillus clintonianus]